MLFKSYRPKVKGKVAEELGELYRHDDELWCSDSEGRERFSEALLGLMPDIVDLPPSKGRRRSDTWDSLAKQALRACTPVERWIIERRTGLWSGGGETTFSVIAKEVETTPQQAKELYREGIRKVAIELVLLLYGPKSDAGFPYPWH